MPKMKQLDRGDFMDKKWNTLCNGKIVRHGAKGMRIYPGTKRGDSYCARSFGQMEIYPESAKNPCSPLRLSRAKWNCRGKKSLK
jgi:hypothetical protein